MTTVKSPQQVPNPKASKSGGSGFVVFLLLITWLVIAAGFYGIKSGLIESDSINPIISERFVTLENKLMAIDGRITDLEKKISELSATSPSVIPPMSSEPTNPAEAPKPIDTMNPTDAKPVDPTAVPVEAPKAGEAAPSDPASAPSLLEAPIDPAAPKTEEKKDAAPGKPQTNNSEKENDTNHTQLLEKKSHLPIAS